LEIITMKKTIVFHW